MLTAMNFDCSGFRVGMVEPVALPRSHEGSPPWRRRRRVAAAAAPLAAEVRSRTTTNRTKQMSTQLAQERSPFETWFPDVEPRPDARVRLICFPPGGSSPLTFRHWQEELGSEVSVCPIALPGRWSRHAEAGFVAVPQLARAAAEVVAASSNRPVALFGYSMGALLAFETARALRDTAAAPIHLVVGALAAPHISIPHLDWHRLHEAEMMARVSRRFGASFDAVLSDPALAPWVYRTMRVDLACYESYGFRKGKPLACPITVFGGNDDRSVEIADLEAWSSHTSGGFALRILAGDHFFIRTEARALLDELRAILLGA